MNSRKQAGIPIGVWLLLAAGLVSHGFSPILVRFAESEPGMVLATWRTALVTLMVAPLLLTREPQAFRRLTLSDWVRIVPAGVMLGLHFVTWMESLYYTSVASASVLVTSSPIFIAVLGWLVLRERLSRWTIGGITIAVAGAGLIAWSDLGEAAVFPRAAFGNSLAITAALLFAGYILFGRVIRRRVSFLAYFVPLNALAAGTAAIACLVQGVDLGIPLPIFGLCLLMALGPGLLGHGSLNVAVKYLPAAIIGLFTLSEPMIAGLLAWILFEEVPLAMSLFGMMLVLGGIALVILKSKRERGGGGIGLGEGH